jgi:hypothetical protein
MAEVTATAMGGCEYYTRAAVGRRLLTAGGRVRGMGMPLVAGAGTGLLLGSLMF